MGTSSDLAVRHRGRTYFQHTSYDGHTENVLSQMAGTIAAAGIEAFRKRMDLEGEPFAEDNEVDEVHVDRKAMGNAYLEACQARGRGPFNLDYAMTYEYGNPDFSHGGAIALLAPKIDWAVGFCDSIEDASVILDLDRGVLTVPAWNEAREEGGYDNGTLESLWTIDLAQIEDLDPQTLCTALSEIDFDEEQDPHARQGAVDAAIASVRTGQVTAPQPQAHHYQPRGFASDEEFQPSIHLLRGLEDHIIYLQPVVDFLRSMADEMPELGDKPTLRITQPEPGEQELIVDLRVGNSQTKNMVSELFESVARDAGMIYAMHGQWSHRMVSMHSTYASAGSGNRDTPWDAGLVPDDAKELGLPADSDARIAKVLQSGDRDRIYPELMFAIIGFNSQRWQTIQDSGRLDDIKPEQMAYIVGIAVDMARHFERAWPGSTAKRFSGLSDGQRSAVLEAMAPVDRYMFTQIVGREKNRGTPRP